MDRTNNAFAQLDALFHPESVAVVGVPKGMKTGKLFLMALLDQGFSGRLYPVNPTAENIDGLPSFPSVTAIPGPVDLAIVLVPQHSVLDVVKECAAKKVKGVVLFTAGGRETGTPQGKVLEEELVRVARSAGMRLFGPNCMGIYAPKSGLSFFPGLSREPGPIGVISHSGSLTNILGRIADDHGLAFSKVVSLGNEADLNSADFLTYLGRDPETTMIAAYLEGIQDGPYFVQSLKDASKNKPVIVWKVGLTPEGGRAASSHTGALAGSKNIWDGVISQTGAIPVVGFEAWVDAMMGVALLPPCLGDRLAIISGPGGLAVSASEACGMNGLQLADLSPETQSALAECIPPTGTSVKNPIDVSLTASLEINMYTRAAEIAAADENVDAVIIAGIGLTPETNRSYTEDMIRIRKSSKKPFVMVNIPGFDPQLARRFCQSGIPFFQSSERALGVYAKVRRYQQWRERESAASDTRV
jgi:acyl-CoA synthetase (NDP forming)